VKQPIKYGILFLIILLTALALRLPRLAQRPMHTDEAVHAVKFGELLEKGDYRYDSNEYHGPTLNYLTLIPAWLSLSTKFTDISEFTLRIVPVFFGVMLIVLLLFMADALQWPALIITAILTAISPAMVYYSRYYVQEMLLVCFTFGAIVSGYRYIESRSIKWALFTGLSLGLMHATKETSIVAYGAMLLALLFTLILEQKKPALIFKTIKAINIKHVIVMGLAAALISTLFYSSFLTNPGGILDSLKTYISYFRRAGHNEIHTHPWYYYLKMICYYQIADGPIWSEVLILILAGVGVVVAITKKGVTGAHSYMIRFIAFYTMIMILLYSAVPYKTPWCMLGFLHGMILLGGIGLISLMKSPVKLAIRMLFSVIFIVGIAHLVWQTYLADYRYEADPVNPYVYGHTSSDVFKIVQRVEEIAHVAPEAQNLYIEVICPGDDYWPLPWYLRAFPNVGWWNKVDMDVPAAPIIIASPDVEEDLIHKLYELPPPGQKNLYVPLFDSYVELRPQVELHGYVVKDLWDRFQDIAKEQRIFKKYRVLSRNKSDNFPKSRVLF